MKTIICICCKNKFQAKLSRAMYCSFTCKSRIARARNPEKTKSIRKKEYQKARNTQLLQKRIYYQENRERLRKEHREYAKLNRAKLNETEKDYRKRNPYRVIKHRACLTARNHISLAGKSCERCGSMDNLERHHPDYSKPLEIIILCRDCHNRETYIKKQMIYMESSK